VGNVQETGENCIIRSLIIFTSTRYSGDQIEENEMCGKCGTCREKINACGASVGKREGRWPCGLHRH